MRVKNQTACIPLLFITVVIISTCTSMEAPSSQAEPPMPSVIHTLEPMAGDRVTTSVDRGVPIANYQDPFSLINVSYDGFLASHFLISISNLSKWSLPFRESQMTFESAEDTLEWRIEKLSSAAAAWLLFIKIFARAGASPYDRSYFLFDSDIPPHTTYSGAVYFWPTEKKLANYYRLSIGAPPAHVRFVFKRVNRLIIGD